MAAWKWQREGIIMTELAHIIPGPSVSLRTSVAQNCRKRSAESRRQNTSRNLLRLWRSIRNRCAGGRDQQTAFSEFVNHARLGFLISLFEREFTARHGTARRVGAPACVEKADWYARIADRR
jgi:hypothetical protein